jgi:hypothetical protein
MHSTQVDTPRPHPPNTTRDVPRRFELYEDVRRARRERLIRKIEEERRAQCTFQPHINRSPSSPSSAKKMKGNRSTQQQQQQQPSPRPTVRETEWLTARSVEEEERDGEEEEGEESGRGFATGRSRRSTQREKEADERLCDEVGRDGHPSKK